MSCGGSEKGICVCGMVGRCVLLVIPAAVKVEYIMIVNVTETFVRDVDRYIG